MHLFWLSLITGNIKLKDSGAKNAAQTTEKVTYEQWKENFKSKGYGKKKNSWKLKRKKNKTKQKNEKQAKNKTIQKNNNKQIRKKRSRS